MHYIFKFGKNSMRSKVWRLTRVTEENEACFEFQTLLGVK